MRPFTSTRNGPTQGPRKILGPYNLRYVHLFVNARAIGAFILSRDGKSADFVGHSADDLAHTIGRTRTGTDYRYFWFAYVRSRKQAADLARYWQHRYRPADNPPPPEGTARSSWRCTVAGCTACALAPRSCEHGSASPA